MTTNSEHNPTPGAGRNSRRALIFELLLMLVLLAGAYFRFKGLMWGEFQYLHPDERFLVWVGSDISPVKNLSEYFNTAVSSLNPVNRGHGFYVYGTLPMFLTRYVVQWVYGHSGFQEMTQVGRPLSAVADLFAILLVYMVAARLYDRRVGLLAAAFSAASVLQIQQSHFFTMDTFINLFTLLAFYFAVRVMLVKEPQKAPAPAHWPVKAAGGEDGGQAVERPSTQPEADPPERLVARLATELAAPLETPVERRIQAQMAGRRETPPEESDPPAGREEETGASEENFFTRFFRHPLFWLSLAFGAAFGMAVASKLNAAPMALALPFAMAIYWLDKPAEEREAFILPALGYLALAGVVSFLVFRVLQPYAFQGPGFFGLKLDPTWLANLRELRAQNSVEVDFPPAMQWARRPIWFSWQNMVLWGLGLPLGLLAWAGFLWAGWRMLKGEWRRHALIWGWTGAYFTWQSMALNPTMRYQLPIYPMLAIFAAWFLVALWDAGRGRAGVPSRRKSVLLPVLAVLLGAGALLLTYGYAYAFTQIYVRPITRIAASRWIYQNVPGPINLHIRNAEGVYNQPIPFPYQNTISPELPYVTGFQPKQSGALTGVYLPHVQDLAANHQTRQLSVVISDRPAAGNTLASATLKADLTPTQDPRGEGFTLQFDRPLPVQKDATYFLILSIGRETATLDVSGQVGLRLNTVGSAGAPGSADQRLPAPTRPIAPMPPYLQNFTPETDGDLQSIFLPTAAAPAANPSSGEPPLLLAVRLGIPGEQQLLINVALPAQPAPADDPRGPGYLLTIDPPVPLLAGQTYFLSIGLNAGNSAIALSGAAVANEGDWDDGLPLRLDGYDAMGGIYPQDVNFNMYTDDNPDKLAHFESIMNQADVIVISSSRQWGSLPRLPERFPMTTLYYRNLLGCPPEDSIEWCYNVAQPGTFQGNLGFKLDQVFESDPSIGPVRINDQFAEEAFTVYDHPKVFIFKKTSSYNPQRVQDILGVVDFSKVIRIPPLKAPAHPLNLMLPSDRWAQQMRGGTWSALFNTQDLQNRYQVVGVILWYLSVLLLGWFVYPLLRLAFPGLPDRGYPLARIAGLLILSYLVWLAGSFRIPFTRLTISVAIGLLAVVGGALAFLQRDELNLELRQRRKYFLAVEGLFLAFFLFDLLIRYGNPDLWHPFMGGEKPMDFSYFNAVLKSTTFPPYDPWFAGGYLNYYYYGFVLVGVLVKWLGIVPAFAYNLILPTIFSLIAMGAFSLAWNLYSSFWLQRKAAPAATGMEEGRVEPPPEGQPVSAYWAGLAGALGMAVLGNLGTVRMIFQGYEKLAAPGGAIENGGLLARWVWAIRGFFLTLAGHPLPYRLNEWYWNPSRAIPAPNEVEPITEFPFFTVLYADPHAHLFALPLTLLALSFALAVFLGHARWRNILGAGLGFLVGGLAIGVLRPTNTWDFPTYLALGVVAVGASILLYFPGESRLGGLPWLRDLPEPSRRLVAAAGGVLLLVVLAFVFFQPYAEWYGLGYTKVDLWKGTHTPISAYLTHWGLFLFVIVSWMAWETRQWMAQTPLSSLRKLQRYQFLIEVAGGLLLLILLGLLLLGARIAWLALPLAAWAGVLLLRPGLPDAKRFILFLVGTGLTLTLMVEVIVLRGDIARMNTVFKFYLQVWTLFAVSAAAALGWLLSALSGWLPGWRRPWQAVLVLLVVGTALYPLMGAMAKVKDRMAPQAPHTLDGMLYMKYATYDWQGQMNLDQDYNAIRWMQENVPGSPVIVEANLRDLYRWGSRYTIYTGLPGVVGWEWHEQQQRALIPSNWISDRINEIDTFYTTTDLNQAQEFLRKYDVQYIVVGQLERNHYPGPGLEKFQAANGVLWRQVYHQADTTIYQVEIDP